MSKSLSLICAICDLDLFPGKVNGAGFEDHVTFVKCEHLLHNSCIKKSREKYKNCCPHCRKYIGEDGFFKILPVFAKSIKPGDKAQDGSKIRAEKSGRDNTERNVDSRDNSRKDRRDSSSDKKFVDMKSTGKKKQGVPDQSESKLQKLLAERDELDKESQRQRQLIRDQLKERLLRGQREIRRLEQEEKDLDSLDVMKSGGRSKQNYLPFL